MLSLRFRFPADTLKGLHVVSDFLCLQSSLVFVMRLRDGSDGRLLSPEAGLGLRADFTAILDIYGVARAGDPSNVVLR